MKIGKSFTFDAAHRLQNHAGKCRNLHGHTYRVLVAVEGEWPKDPLTDPSSDGMLLDFAVLSQWWKSMDAIFDHKVILQEEDPFVAALQSVGREGTSMTLFPWPPTAENIAEWMRNDLWDWLKTKTGEGFIVHVRVYETPTSWAEA